MAWEVIASAKGFREALKALRRRVPMTDAAFKALLTASHETAFTIAHATHLEIIAMVWQSLDRAIDQGTDLREWKKDVGPMLKAAWGNAVKNPGARLDTIFQNAAHTSYNHGRWEQMNDPDVLALRPFREFKAIRDKRTSDICKECNGTILPADDPWWDGHVPPLHHRCRSKVSSLTKRQALRRPRKPAPDTPPQQGFGALPKPGRAHIDAPDPKNLPAPLREIYERKLGQ